FYMDYAKDILYVEKKDSLRRRQVQTVFYECTDGLCRLWAPILSFTAEEVYSHFKPECESVFLTEFPQVTEYPDAEKITAKWEKYMNLRSDILKALEVAKNDGVIKKALDAIIYLNVKPDYRDCIEGLTEHDLAQLVIAFQLKLTDEKYDEYETSFIKIDKAEGHVCPRCWNVVTHVDSNGLCDRCHGILEG
ncbi:MAG: class I tRNA ligase family protein, partial [Erysipelotrichaceae bacterium]|nr:class I tRNA ligase family protein [Erysipelotrichaceae bacterium]